MEDHINVAIRVRPLNQRERSSTASTLGQTPWQVHRDSITQLFHADGRTCFGNTFTFDKVFDQRDTTLTVYNDIVKEIVASSMRGFNGTIFAYGQTSSGKTHTMYGSGTELGIIKLAVRNMFDIADSDSSREYLIRVSFLEIYNEILRDLLEPSKTNLKIHENTKREIYVGNLTQHVVSNADEVEYILRKGDSNRQVAGTNMNERSSRSHTIFSIIVESREKADPATASASDGDGRGSDTLPHGHQRLSTGSGFGSGEFAGAVMVSSLNLVDLAGSERVGQTGAEGQRLKEGSHINKSLHALGNVIVRLADDGGDRGHIPYRDSKLTRILQPSLGGNAKTLIICTITPSPDYIDEAVSTLKFASRAKTIQNKPEVNEEVRGNTLLWRIERDSKLELERKMVDVERKMAEAVREKEVLENQSEALMRKIWRMQKESEELKLSMSNAASNTIGSVSENRRQTWHFGLQRTQSDGTPALNRTSLSHPSAAIGGLATAMDVDEGPIDQTVTVRSRSRAGYNGNSDQLSDSRTRDLELRNKSLELQNKDLLTKHDEASKQTQDMSRELERITRDYTMILSELGQLTKVADIPPSPVKDAPSTQPRELADTRRRLRELLAALSESRKHSIKLRSQRSEAEFLEMEKQATQEALIQREGELSASQLEVEELRSQLSETLRSLELAEGSRLSYEKQLAEAVNAKTEALKECRITRAKMEQERLGLTSTLRSQKEMAAATESRLETANSALQAKLDEQLSLSEHQQQLAKSMEDEQQQARAALDKAKADMADKQGEADALSRDLGATRRQVSGLELKLVETTAALGTAKADCLEAKAKVQEAETEKAKAVANSAKLSEVAKQLESKLVDADVTISELRNQAGSLEVAANDAAADRLSLQAKVDCYSQVVSELKAGTSASIDAAQREIDSLKLELEARVAELGARTADINGLRQELEASQLAGADAATTKQRLWDAEEALNLCNGELAGARAALDELNAMRAVDKEELRNHHTSLKNMMEQLSALAVQLGNTELEHTRVLAERDSRLVMLQSLGDKAVERADQLAEQLASAEACLSSTRAELAQKQTSLAAEVSLKADLHRQIEANAATIRGMQADLTQLRMEVDDKARMLSESESQRNHFSKHVGEELAAAQAQALAAQESFDGAALKHRDDIAKLEAQIQDGLGRISELQQTIADGDCTGVELRQQLNMSTAARDALVEEMQELKSQAIKVLADLSMAANKANQMQARAEAAERATEETRQELQKQVDDLRAQNSRTRDDITRLQQACDALTGDVQHYKSLAESSAISVDQSKKMLRDVESVSSTKITALQTQLDATTAERDRLQKEAADKSSQLGDTALEHDKLRSELDALRLERTSLLEKHADLSSLSLNLSASVESANTKCNEALAQCDEQRGLAKSYAVQLEDLQSTFEDRVAELATASEARVALEGRLAELQQALETKVAECARLSTQTGDEIKMRHAATEHLGAIQTELRAATAAEQQHRHRIGVLEADLRKQHEAQSQLQESISGIHAGHASAKKAAVERIESLEADLAGLRCQLLAMHTKCDTLERELEESRAATSGALLTNGVLADESQKLRADYEALAGISKSMRADMEQAIADLQSKMSGKSGEIRDLEAALESANAALEAARAEVGDATRTSIEKLESQVAVSGSRAAELEATIASMRAEIEHRAELVEAAASEHASLMEATAMIERLSGERDQAYQSIEMLKSMMTELADIKDAEYAEVEEKLAQQAERLQAATSELSEKDEFVKQLEGQAAKNLSRAVAAEADMDKALVLNSLDIEKLTTERDTLEAKLEATSVACARLEARVAESTANGDCLQLEIERHEMAVADLQKRLDHATVSLADADAGAATAKQELRDLVASVSAELLAVAKSLSALPGCAQVADVDLEATSTSHHVLLAAIREMAAVANSGTEASDSAQSDEDMSRLRELNEKLEKKIAKLRDMYKSDMTKLHAEEEKHRLQAESLAKQLAATVCLKETADGELARVRGDLEAQSQRLTELKATVAQRDSVVQYDSPDAKTKARLASQRTPMAHENKRAYLVSPSATLSPISLSTLNSRMGASEDQHQKLYPPRKRTALGPDASANGVEAAAKADPLRARSSYGDRRRLRRNQQAPRPDGLEEQATEQCVQQ